ncbi:MAG: hypothetical protein IT203_00460 [Fimbriimonadaceae bacterium]|nr:hypothetical protein [Fimbriimonadaceae bacterium]
MDRTVPKLALAFAMLLGAVAQAQQVAPPFEQDILKFEAQDAKNPPAKGGVVFVGSSTIRLWTSLAQDFPEYNVINRGFGGSTLADSVRYAHRIVTPYEPRLVVLFAGTNDLANGKSAENVSQDFAAFVTKVRETLPKVKIAFLSISPTPSRWNKIEEIKRANRLIEANCHKGRDLTFLNTFPKMLDAKGGPRPELYVSDRLHLNQDGYKILVAEVRRLLPKK